MSVLSPTTTMGRMALPFLNLEFLLLEFLPSYCGVLNLLLIFLGWLFLKWLALIVMCWEMLLKEVINFHEIS